MAKAIIVSKDKDSSYLFKVALSFQKIESTIVSGVSSAIQAIKKNIPDLIIFDVRGFEITELKKIEALGEKIKNLPIVIFADIHEQELKQKAALLKATKKLIEHDGMLGDVIKFARKALK